MKLAKDFECVPDGEIYPRVLPAGSECPAELVDAARSLGLLAETAEAAPVVTEKPGKPAKRKAG